MDYGAKAKEYDEFFKYLENKWSGKLEHLYANNELENKIKDIIKVAYQIPKNVFSNYSIEKLTTLRKFIGKYTHLITVFFIRIGAELSEKELPYPYEIEKITNDVIQPIIQEISGFKSYCSEEDKQRLQPHLDQLFTKLIDFSGFCQQIGSNHKNYQNIYNQSTENKTTYVDENGIPLNLSIEEIKISFYDSTNISVSHPKENFNFPNVNENISQEFFNEIFLLSCYTIRQIRNFSGQPTGGKLVEELKKWDMNEIINQISSSSFDNEKIIISWEHINLKELTEYFIKTNKLEKSFTNNVYLVPYRGIGEKNISLKFLLKKNRIFFILKTKGFERFGKNARIETNMHMPGSVFAFFTFYLSKSNNNERFINAIKYVATQCANEYYEKSINMKNQEYLALLIAIEACGL